MSSLTTYEIELWSPSGIRLADITRLAHNRSYTIERNEAETVTFDLDLTAFESFCSSMGVSDPRTILTPYQTDVKLKRNGQYFLGAQVIGVTFNLPANNGGVGNGPASFSETVSVTASGYLNLFKDRYVTVNYSQQDAAFIAWDLINQTQSQTNGSCGVTRASSPYMTGVLRDRTYTRQNVKTGIQNLTQLVDGRFDFGFSWDKQFQTYSQIGSRRQDLQFIYGGPDSNVAGFYLERSAASLYNRVIDLGSGFGPDQLVSTADDTPSQLANYLREDIKQDNSVINQPVLDQNAAAYLALEKDLLEIPQITITGNELSNVPFLSVGDRIPIVVKGHSFLGNINGYYRIEKLTVTIDDNDFESAIELYFDSFAVGNN